jgi:hypothetical protein
MVDRIHGNTTGLGPGVTLDGIFVLRTGGLQQRLVRSSTTCNDAYHTTNATLDNLFRAAGKLDTGFALIWIVSDNCDISSASTSELELMLVFEVRLKWYAVTHSSSIANFLLDVGYHGTFGNSTQGKDVADGQGSVLASIDELPGVHALVSSQCQFTNSKRYRGGFSYAMKVSVWSLNRYGSRKTTFARGAPRPGS